MTMDMEKNLLSEKSRTFIEGFDQLVGGGFPKGCSVLLSGTPGTGKTIFALQYVCNGAVQSHEKGLYVTLEESADNLRRQAKQFGLDLEKLEKQGLVTLLEITPRNVTESSVKEILKKVERGKYERMVIDSLSALAINTPNTLGSVKDITEIFIKRFMYPFIGDILSSDATTLLISQAVDEKKLSNEGVSEFVCDGVVHFRFETLGGPYSRSLLVRKMREVKNDEDIHPLEISSKGIAIHNLR